MASDLIITFQKKKRKKKKRKGTRMFFAECYDQITIHPWKNRGCSETFLLGAKDICYFLDFSCKGGPLNYSGMPKIQYFFYFLITRYKNNNDMLTRGDNRYFLTFMNDCSKFTYVFLLKIKIKLSMSLKFTKPKLKIN